MKYISTRGQGETRSFREVLLAGLADDGGLYVPESLPALSREDIRSLAGLPYNELAFKIIQPFVGDEIATETLRQLIDKSYASFSHKAVAPLVQLEHNHFVMELFHGPTLAFKDFALQLLGRLLNQVLTENNERAVVLGATSGDTGSAAIEGCRGSNHLDIFILHPYQRVSNVQRRQMTTVPDDNIHNIAIKGNFDDCQQMVKQCFADQSFLPGNTRLVAVNSINWARIMAQVVYYFYAALNLGAPDKAVSFSVPTGNFGDVYAGYIARSMGLPVNKLIVATNANDILHRFFTLNDYSCETLLQTLAPSMDIMVSSNFERLLFDLNNRDGKTMAQLMARFGNSGELSIPADNWKTACQTFDSCRTDDEEICATIRQIFTECRYLADPHTATALRAVRELEAASESAVVSLATAHPVKFPDAFIKAGLSAPELPGLPEKLLQREERYQILDHDTERLKTLIRVSL